MIAERVSNVLSEALHNLLLKQENLSIEGYNSEDAIQLRRESQLLQSNSKLS